MQQRQLPYLNRLIVKIGSSLLTNPDASLSRKFILALVKQLSIIREQCPQLVIVTSGAVTAGLPILGWQTRPSKFADMHVAAAAGQIALFRAYDETLSEHNFRPAQVLLTAEELSHRTTYLNARSTLQRLLEMGLLPVINENDAIAISERRFGDNDRLAAELTNLLEAQLLIILTDVDGIYTDDAHVNVLNQAYADDGKLMKLVSNEVPSKFGSGGMTGKVEAANRAAHSGAHTIIANGNQPNILIDLLAGKPQGTYLQAPTSGMRAKERWLASCTSPQGNLHLDQGAANAVLNQQRSLLPIGITQCAGDFKRGDVVDCLAPNGKLVARGLVNYDIRDTALLIRRHSKDISEVLGYVFAEEIVHRDNMIVFKA